jgi:hypothetical protein
VSNQGEAPKVKIIPMVHLITAIPTILSKNYIRIAIFKVSHTEITRIAPAEPNET